MMNAGRDSRGWEINRLPLEYKPPSSLLLISETLYENSMTPDRSMIAFLTRFFWKVLPKQTSSNNKVQKRGVSTPLNTHTPPSAQVLWERVDLMSR